MSDMADVLAGHQLCAAWEDEAGRALICTCGVELPTEPERGEIDMTFLAAHQAAALSAAGFGPVREGRAEAWDHGHHDGAVDAMLHMENDGAKTTPNPYREDT